MQPDMMKMWNPREGHQRYSVSTPFVFVLFFGCLTHSISEVCLCPEAGPSQLLLADHLFMECLLRARLVPSVLDILHPFHRIAVLTPFLFFFLAKATWLVES